MREDLPSRELQDLRPVPGDGRIPLGWVRAVYRACTVWLLERGLLGESDAENIVIFEDIPWYGEEDADIDGMSEDERIAAALRFYGLDGDGETTARHEGRRANDGASGDHRAAFPKEDAS